MVRKIWLGFEAASLEKRVKANLFIGLMIIICACLGAVAWLALGRLLLSDAVWLFCFMGYPAAFGGLFGGIFYILRHEFS